jgi:ribonuclease Z
VGPTREGRKVVISGDTAPCEALAVAAHQADVLVHEATFVEEEGERARQTGHSTARQAARLAREAEVRMLVLTHLSTRYSGGEVQSEARAVFAATEVPRDFDTVEVPFPERGPARLVRWSNRPQAAPQGTGAGGAEGAGEHAQVKETSDGTGVPTPQDTEAVASSIIP